jgi:hypothetical protein
MFLLQGLTVAHLSGGFDPFAYESGSGSPGCYSRQDVANLTELTKQISQVSFFFLLYIKIEIEWRIEILLYFFQFFAFD